MKKLIALFLSLSMALSFMAGCGGGDKAGETVAEDKGEAAADSDNAGSDNTAENENSSSDSDQKVVMSLIEEAEQLDPTLNNYANSSLVLQNLFAGLFRLDADNKPQKLYCEDYTVDETGTKYVFTIVEGAKWSDGTPLTAHDFEYSWKRVVNPEVASKTAFSGYVFKNGQACADGEASLDDVGVKAVDDRTLEVELEGPTTYFIDLLGTTAFYPIKKDLAEAAEPWTKTAETYVSTGPFMMKEIAPAEKYVLVKNPNYIKADSIKLDEITYRIINSQESQLFAYMNDEISISVDLSNEAMQQYKDTGEFQSVPRFGLYFMDFNVEHEPFNDVRVRKALAYSIDRQALIDNVLMGDNEPAYGFVPLGIPDTANPDKSYRETAGDLFSENIDEAKKLLAEAGFPDGQGFPKFKFITISRQVDMDMAQAMQEMWRTNLGIECEIVTFESKVYWDEHAAGNFDMARDGYTGDYPDPLCLLEQNNSEKQKGETRWGNAEFDRLVNENRTITDQTKRMENAMAAERITIDEFPNFPVYYYTSPYVVKPYLKGVYRTNLGHVIFDNAYIEK